MPHSSGHFVQIKNYLLKRRYPSMAKNGFKARPSFFDINIDPTLKVDVTARPAVKPQNIYIEESVADTEMAARIKTLFPEATVETITTYKEHIKGCGLISAVTTTD